MKELFESLTSRIKSGDDMKTAIATKYRISRSSFLGVKEKNEGKTERKVTVQFILSIQMQTPLSLMKVFLVLQDGTKFEVDLTSGRKNTFTMKPLNSRVVTKDWSNWTFTDGSGHDLGDTHIAYLYSKTEEIETKDLIFMFGEDAFYDLNLVIQDQIELKC